MVGTPWIRFGILRLSTNTVTIQFSARGAYLLLVPQERALIWDRAPISFLRNYLLFKTKRLYYFYLKRDNNRNCKSNDNKYMLNVQLT